MTTYLTGQWIHSVCSVCGCTIKRDVLTNGSRWEADPKHPTWGRFTCPKQPAGYVKGGRRGHQAGEDCWF